MAQAPNWTASSSIRSLPLVAGTYGPKCVASDSAQRLVT